MPVSKNRKNHAKKVEQREEKMETAKRAWAKQLKKLLSK
jgi:hypothetical protein